MKVAFDHQIFCLQRYGGISRYVAELASRLPSQGISDVSVVAPLHINDYLTADSLRRFTVGRYVPWASAEISRFVAAANRVAAPVILRKLKPDIVHETYFAVKPVGKVSQRVVTVHDMIHELFPEEFPDAERAGAAKRAAVNRADHIICVSDNTRQDLIRLYSVDPDRTSVVHLGASTTTNPHAPTPNTGSDRPLLLYVGHRRGYKNFTTLLQACSSSPILREFDLVAFGGPRPTSNERREISKLGLGDRVHFEAGSDQKLTTYYRRATAFVYPSKYEGFGIPPLEAMSHGCPVVCSDRSSIPEVVGDAGVYFDPDDVEDLRTSLERVASAEELQVELRTRGRARLDAFSWENCAAATAEIYRNVRSQAGC